MDRYKIVPQMFEYDRLGVDWIPYLMFRSKKNVRNKTVNTDRYGFRLVIDAKGQSHSLDTISKNESVNVFVGSSCGFGVGASSDQKTIPSLLCQKSSSRWINLSGRAYNSFQELLNFLLYFKLNSKKIDKVIIYSGVNNLLLSLGNKDGDSHLAPFFFNHRFREQMLLPKTIKGFAKDRLKGFFGRSGNVEEGVTVPNTSESYRKSIDVFERDMHLWRALSQYYGFELNYILQPYVEWIDKPLSDKEKALFSILDQSQESSWDSQKKYIRQLKDRYASDLEKVCSKLEVPFYNLNKTGQLTTREWLFVDRVHMTDEGYDLVANFIVDKVLGGDQVNSV